MALSITKSVVDSPWPGGARGFFVFRAQGVVVGLGAQGGVVGWGHKVDFWLGHKVDFVWGARWMFWVLVWWVFVGVGWTERHYISRCLALDAI